MGLNPMRLQGHFKFLSVSCLVDLLELLRLYLPLGEQLKSPPTARQALTLSDTLSQASGSAGTPPRLGRPDNQSR